MMPVVRILREAGSDPGIALPSYESDGAAGADLRANLPEDLRAEGIMLAPGERVLVPTGLRVEIPDGYEMQIRPRSGLALKHGVSLANTPGTIDSDYRGPLGIILINLGTEPFVVTHGERIAQSIVASVTRVRFSESKSLGGTARGLDGFGSTGRS